MSNSECAEMFCKAIKQLVENPVNLSNMESYLSHHFDVWMREYANDPENLAAEMRAFAEIQEVQQWKL